MLEPRPATGGRPAPPTTATTRAEQGTGIVTALVTRVRSSRRSSRFFVTGVVVDDVGDLIAPGAFARILRERDRHSGGLRGQRGERVGLGAVVDVGVGMTTDELEMTTACYVNVTGALEVSSSGGSMRA